ncbi:phosphotransferase [Micromonospora sp. CPCC 205546]|uniref:phosphotransferase family protein n=1 Tax=Micromonospora sp. CPCC 205546 TaxID=3122397 RepID=UPI002FF1A988
MRQGAVGHVRLVERRGRRLVEKRMTEPSRHDTEVLALRALADTGIPAPELVEVSPGAILMSLMPGERLDSNDADVRLDGLRASATLLRRLHELEPPDGLPAAPDDALIVRRYRDAGGPPLPFAVPPAGRAVFCHGDWTDGNLLAVNGDITAVVDWEAAHLGDPLRELARAAWGAARKDPRSFDVLVEEYGADPAVVRAWSTIHAAELWLWFAEAGPPEYLEQLTGELRSWPTCADEAYPARAAGV